MLIYLPNTCLSKREGRKYSIPSKSCCFYSCYR